MLHFHLTQTGSRVDAYFDSEPERRNRLLSAFLNDMYDQEELYLGELVRAEKGEPDVIVGNHGVWALMFSDKVILEEMLYGAERENGTDPARTEITLGEARQLILDWLAAKKRWYAEHAA